MHSEVHDSGFPTVGKYVFALCGGFPTVGKYDFALRGGISLSSSHKK
jgi:hypothetical protein